ncbi:hypothetical protein [Dactylosporangium sp. CA-092794]|uniref:hypothetical protein n=1 Tax=Dactylosporangium sp. CA-092794 TaxID=3239929 RepID=UPI003D93F12B
MTLAATGVALRPGQEQGAGRVPAAEAGRLQISLIPAPVDPVVPVDAPLVQPEPQPQHTGTRVPPDAPDTPDRRGRH